MNGPVVVTAFWLLVGALVGLIFLSCRTYKDDDWWPL